MARRRKGKHGGGHEESGEERWLLTYADMITLLMIFFIVLYSMANTDLKKFAQVSLSIKKGFNIPTENISVFSAGTGSLLDQGGLSVGEPSPLVIQSLPQQQQDYIQLSEALSKFAKEEGLAKSISINNSPQGIVITLPAALLFEPGSATLQNKAKSVVAKIAEMLRPLPNTIRVEGNTDNTPTNSPLYPTNWELSTARAVSVVRYLIDHGHLAPKRLQAAGMGEYNPVVRNDTRSHRAINRRADIVVLYPASDQEASIPGLKLSNSLEPSAQASSTPSRTAKAVPTAQGPLSSVTLPVQ